MDGQRRLPWWKEIALNDEYRKRVRCLVTARYREEMRILQDRPDQIASACWDDGSKKRNSAQFIRVRNKDSWSTKHPMSVIKVSAIQVVRKTAEAVVVEDSSENKDAAVLDEIQRLFWSEKDEKRIYGLSYIWDCQLPPNGFIRLNPDPLAAMWPSFSGKHATMEGNKNDGPLSSPSDAQQQDPLCVNVYRENGEHLGLWRQSLLLLRFKITCWALREEERQRTSANVLPTIPEMKNVKNISPILDDVPIFSLPILRIQRGTVTYKRASKSVDVDTIMAPNTWEGIAPSPTMFRAELTYQNWHGLHRRSALVYQSLRDVYDLLPHNEAGLLTKETYVEFTLDLLDLFFPSFLSSTSIAIAEEEWIYRGTTELVNFETFFEKFFSFPLIFLRDLSTVTREQYAEVWCLVRVCLLETPDTIDASVGIPETSSDDEVENEKKNSKNKSEEEEVEEEKKRGPYRFKKLNASAILALSGSEENAKKDKGKLNGRRGNLADNALRRPISMMGATLTSVQRLRVVKERAKKKSMIPLICDIVGLNQADIIRLGKKDFRNKDNYALYNAKKAVALDKADAMRWIPPSHLANVLHSLGEQKLAKEIVASSLSPFATSMKEYEESDLQGTITQSGHSGVDYNLSGGDFNGSTKKLPKGSDTDDNSLCISDSHISSPLTNSKASRATPQQRADRVRERLDALTRLEDERRVKELCQNSMLYRARRRRQYKEHKAVRLQVVCSHTGWELFRDDVFVVPEDTHDAEDALVSYVLDFPDDFFDDPQHSLRERHAIQQALVTARVMQRLRCPSPGGGGGEAGDGAGAASLASLTSGGPDGHATPCGPALASLTSALAPAPAPAPLAPLTPAPAPAPLDPAPPGAARWSERSIAGWSRRDAAPLLRDVRAYTRVPWGVKDLPPVLTASESALAKERLADSDPSIWLPPRGDEEAERVTAEMLEERQREESRARQALRKRLRRKEKIDAQYMQSVQAKSRISQVPHTARVTKKKTHSPEGGRTFPSVSWRKN